MAAQGEKQASFKDYIKKHEVEPLLVQAIKAANETGAEDPVTFIGHFMLKKGAKDDGQSSDAAAYVNQSAIGAARQRTAWLLFFLFGLLVCANVMHEFEGLLAREIELAFFVPLLIGHGGNSGGQVVSTVIRALGSGAAKLSDGPRVILKEACAGLMQSCVLVCALAPALMYGLGISQNVSVVVSLALPCIGTFANALGATLPFVVTYFGHDPAVIVGPLMTTSVDSIGLMLYLVIAQVYLSFAAGPKLECTSTWNGGCKPANALTAACTKSGKECVGVGF